MRERNLAFHRYLTCLMSDLSPPPDLYMLCAKAVCSTSCNVYFRWLLLSFFSFLLSFWLKCV